MTKVNHAVTSEQTAQSKNARSISDLSGRISSAEDALIPLTPYNMTCSQYLTGPNGGPETFVFPCAEKKPGS
jgi:hypothetical protein